MQLSSLIKKEQKKWHISLFLTSIFLFISIYFSLSTGEIWLVPFDKLTEFEFQILMQLRVPRVIAAILIGASLAISGCILQLLLGNTLAEPGVLGISGGASLTLIIALFFFPHLSTTYGLMLCAMCGALIITGLLVYFSRLLSVTTTRLLLIGISLNMLTGALVTWAFYFSSEQNLRQLLYWLMGSLSGVDWSHLILAFMMIPILLWLCLQGRKLDLLMLGETQAQQLGLDTYALRWKLILLVSLLVGASVALAGVIGFVGLIVPHFIRLLLGSKNSYLLPISALFGAILLLLSDTLGRIAIAEAELPVGAVTTTVGTPLFIWMLLKRA
jgi:vitamin B12 transport system permease protein